MASLRDLSADSQKINVYTCIHTRTYKYRSTHVMCMETYTFYTPWFCISARVPQSLKFNKHRGDSSIRQGRRSRCGLIRGGEGRLKEGEGAAAPDPCPEGGRGRDTPSPQRRFSGSVLPVGHRASVCGGRGNLPGDPG